MKLAELTTQHSLNTLCSEEKPAVQREQEAQEGELRRAAAVRHCLSGTDSNGFDQEVLDGFMLF